MIARYTASAGTATAVTFGLLFVMQLVVATGRPSVDAATRHRLTPWVRVLPPPDPPPHEPPERPDVPPPPPRPLVADDARQGPIVTVPAPAPPAPPRRFSGGFGMTDGDALPIVKVLPVYPRAALTAGLEGYVIVEFTITRAGGVADVSVVESSHRVFERAAIDAAAKFRYRPRIVNGEPIAVPGKRHLVSFDLDD